MHTAKRCLLDIGTMLWLRVAVYMYAYFLVMYVCVSCNDVVMLVDIGIYMRNDFFEPKFVRKYNKKVCEEV